jgi:hypothetical protein
LTCKCTRGQFQWDRIRLHIRCEWKWRYFFNKRCFQSRSLCQKKRREKNTINVLTLSNSEPNLHRRTSGWTPIVIMYPSPTFSGSSAFWPVATPTIREPLNAIMETVVLISSRSKKEREYCTGKSRVCAPNKVCFFSVCQRELVLGWCEMVKMHFELTCKLSISERSSATIGRKLNFVEVARFVNAGMVFDFFFFDFFSLRVIFGTFDFTLRQIGAT